MFTGIVREVGRVAALHSGDGVLRIRVRAPGAAANAAIGDSVALNGVCLTATEVADGTLSFDAVPETLVRSTLAHLRPDAPVNVEPALRAGDPVGGHIVQGHVDGVGRVERVEPDGEGRRLEVAVPPELERYCVEKGSVAVDGVSLTIAEVGPGWIAVALVPHTLAATTLVDLAPGDDVNVEADVLAKQVERLLEARGTLS